MKLGVIGLGRMGGNISLRLMKHGHECVVYDNSEKAVDGIVGQGAAKSSGLEDMVKQLPSPRSSGSCCPPARSPRTRSRRWAG